MRKQFLTGYFLGAALLLWSLLAQNYEFLIYAVTVLILVALIKLGDRNYHFNGFVLWGFNLWIIMHIFGGLMPVGDSVMYNLILIDIVGEPYSILKYDQFVHVYCYFIAGLLMWQIVASFKPQSTFHGPAIVTVLAASGVGCLNEIIEFTATVLVPDTNVGGYENTALDIVANFLGASIAALFFKKLDRTGQSEQA